MLTVHKPDGDTRVACPKEKTLLAALVGGGVFVDAPCGGGGKCGKCRVRAHGALSPLTDDERQLLTPAERADGFRLACRTYAEGDAEVWVAARTGEQVETEGRGGDAAFAPAALRVPLRVPAGTLREQTDDASRVTAALAAAGKPVREVAPAALGHMPAVLRAADGEVDALLYRERLLDVVARGTPMLGMAVDIGTTTVVAYFHDLCSGVRLGLRSALNPQRAYGADVISRIAACAGGDGLRAQQAAIVGLLGDMAASFAAEAGVGVNAICHVTVAANTTMLHLLAGIDPTNIAVAPFIAATAFGFDLPARTIGLGVLPDAPVTLLPCVSGYVGADITAGLAACGLDRSNERVVYLDIGTNGEMAYSDGERLLCCATAAGPAFEGAQIKCGTGGIPGAVRGMTVDGDRFFFDTIGGGEPSGICGSGLIDMTAALLAIGAVDETGRLLDGDELEEPWASRIDAEGDFVFHAPTGLVMTAKDVREVQLAKAAIRAGIHSLLDAVGVGVGELDRLVIAGGFGAHIRPESACAIGLLPPEALGKLEMVGNAAGMGATLALLDADAPARIAALTRRCEYLELSGSAFFQDEYIDQMMFGE